MPETEENKPATDTAKPVTVTKEQLQLAKENATLKDKLAKSQDTIKTIADQKKAIAEELKGAKASNVSLVKENDALKVEIESLKSQPKAEEAAIVANDTITLKDGKAVKINFGVNIPELGSSLSKADLLENEDAVTYLLEIGSGAVSIVDADIKTEEV